MAVGFARRKSVPPHVCVSSAATNYVCPLSRIAIELTHLLAAGIDQKAAPVSRARARG